MSLQTTVDALRKARETSNLIAKESFKVGMIIIVSLLVIGFIISLL